MSTDRGATVGSGAAIGIGLVDPYLVFLIQRQVPDARIVQVVDAEPWDPSLDVVLVRPDDPRLATVGPGSGPRVAVVLDRPDHGVHVPGASAYLRRPIDAVALSAILSRLLDGDAEVERAPRAVAHRAFGIARLAAAGVAAVFEAGQPPSRSLLLVVVVAYAALRLALQGRPERVLVWGDATVALVALATTGGALGPYLALGVVAAAQLGSEWAERGIVLGAAVLGAVVAAASASAVLAGEAPISGALTAIVFPIAGMVGASLLAGRWSVPPSHEEADRTRGRLLDLEHDLLQAPGRFDAVRVAEQAVEDAVSLLGYERALVAVADAELLVAATAGLPNVSRGTPIDADAEALAVASRDGSIVTSVDALPAPLQVGPPGEWSVTALRYQRDLVGYLLVSAGPVTSGSLRRVEELAADTAMAIHNARLFRRLRALAADDERRRVARELHDGVAQTLTHIRLELALAERAGDATAARLVGLLDQVNHEVRESIARLSGGPRGGDLAEGVARYVAEIDGTLGVGVTLAAPHAVRVDAATAQTIFAQVRRSVMEAVTTPGTQRVLVSLGFDGDEVVANVHVDEGRGERVLSGLRYRLAPALIDRPAEVAL